MEKKFKYYSFVVRVFLIKILLKLSDIFGRLPVISKKRCGRNQKRIPLCYYSSEKIVLNSKELEYDYNTTPFEEVLKYNDNIDIMQCGCSKYDWEGLIEDIRVNGIKNTPIAVRYLREDSPTIIIEDGNHRLKVLEVLYGKDYEALIDIYVPLNYIEYLKALYKNKKNLMKDRLLIIKNKTYAQE